MTESERTVLIETNAGGPSSVAVDGQSTSSRPLTELIEVDRYLAAKEGVKKPTLGLRFVKLSLPGTV